jgi:hypothetical protein
MASIIALGFDYVRFSGSYFDIKYLKALCHKTFDQCLGLSYWVEEMIADYRKYQFKQIEANTSIVIYYTHPDASEEFQHQSEFECVIPGNQWSRLSLQEQWQLFNEINTRYHISSLHLKVQIDNPLKSIKEIKDIAGIDEDAKSLSKDVCYFHSGQYIVSNAKDDCGADRTINFSSRESHKQLCIYDPSAKHAVDNAQHWELRIRWKYLFHALHLLSGCQSEDEFSQMVKSIVFGSIDFRSGDAKHINRRARHPWYERLIKGIEPIKLMQNETFDKRVKYQNTALVTLDR